MHHDQRGAAVPRFWRTRGVEGHHAWLSIYQQHLTAVIAVSRFCLSAEQQRQAKVVIPAELPARANQSINLSS
jgi:hypothetical protein